MQPRFHFSVTFACLLVFILKIISSFIEMQLTNNIVYISVSFPSVFCYLDLMSWLYAIAGSHRPSCFMSFRREKWKKKRERERGRMPLLSKSCTYPGICSHWNQLGTHSYPEPIIITNAFHKRCLKGYFQKKWRMHARGPKTESFLWSNYSIAFQRTYFYVQNT